MPSLREKLNRIIFHTETKTGNFFDILVIWLIILSIGFIILDSVKSISLRYARIFTFLQWGFTIIFTIEYILRIYASKNRWKYVTSFFGIVDLLAILPSYYSIFFTASRHLLIIRILRLLRIFRIFQMGHFIREGSVVASALRASKTKIIVFLSFVLIASVLMGAIMYIVEEQYNPHIQNIPEGIYWAIVTLTTVGYGDTIPVTNFGKVLASIVMILGYGIIAIPTGIVTAEITSRVLESREGIILKCKKCGSSDHLQTATFCHHCGESL